MNARIRCDTSFSSKHGWKGQDGRLTLVGLDGGKVWYWAMR